jgi:hypothetical protein
MSKSYLPSGNCEPMHFMKADTSKAAGGYVLQAGAGERVIGISQPGTWQAAIVGLDDGFAGIADTTPIIVFTETDECWVISGGAFSTDDLLKSDANGEAVVASSDADQVGAVALESSTAAGKKVRVRVRIMQRAS